MEDKIYNSYLVSVLIPVYNASKYLEATLDSLLKQTYPFLEIIIIDDHSTDDSWQIISKFSETQKRILSYKNKMKGAASARNYAFSLSKGDFIQYLDADDILHPEKIKKQLDYLANYNFKSNLLIGCQWRFFTTNIENLYGPVCPLLVEKQTIYSNRDWLILRPDMALMGWLFSRSQIESVNGWNEDLTRNDDGDLLYRIIWRIKEIHVIPKLLVYYRREDTMSLSKNLSKESLISWVKSAITYKNIISDVAPTEGRESSDKFMFFLYYICLFRDTDLAKKCYSELYYPERIYEVGDNFVFKLSKVSNIRFAKIIRRSINWIRGLDYV